VELTYGQEHAGGEVEPRDEDEWGVAKPQYMFVDLVLWNKQGTLNDPGGSQTVLYPPPFIPTDFNGI
jgi:hypothetical protein